MNIYLVFTIVSQFPAIMELGEKVKCEGRPRLNKQLFGKGVCQSFILSPCLFNLYAEYIMRNARLDEAKAGIKIVGRNISITSDMQMTSPLWQKVKKN